MMVAASGGGGLLRWLAAGLALEVASRNGGYRWPLNSCGWW